MLQASVAMPSALRWIARIAGLVSLFVLPVGWTALFLWAVRPGRRGPAPG